MGGARQRATPLNMRTNQGSTSFGNVTATPVTLASGQAVLFATAFLFALTFQAGVVAIDFLETERSFSATAAGNLMILAGLPGMSVPAGFMGALPVGMQLVGNLFQEERLLAAAHQFQQATDWHRRRPEAFK